MSLVKGEGLQQALHDALVEIATQKPDPLAYLQSARSELELILAKRFGDGSYEIDPNSVRTIIARALNAVWPDVIAHFSN